MEGEGYASTTIRFSFHLTYRTFDDDRMIELLMVKMMEHLISTKSTQISGPKWQKLHIYIVQKFNF